MHGYNDDLLIFNKTEDEHLEHMTILFDHLNHRSPNFLLQGSDCSGINGCGPDANCEKIYNYL